jgi:nucleoside-diphosphate-sugar epimerase/pimeloyl-ACP methyl ester carboxylesterase
LDSKDNPLQERSLALADGTSGRYFVYTPEAENFERVLVYIHGLISDHHWFRLPEDIPPGTAVLFLPRQPRLHVERFEQWSENYQACLEDFKKHYQATWYHLLAQCFGVQPGLHWASTHPQNFDTLTIVSPPRLPRSQYDVKTKAKIFMGPKKGAQKAMLEPEHYGRLASLIRFINENPTTTYDFSNAFWSETQRLRNWLDDSLVCYPAPTHCIYTSDDEVAEPVELAIDGDLKELPSRTSFLYGFHFMELLPNHKLFWERSFEFMLANEKKIEIGGPIETVLVTGASGFLGSHLVRRLHREGFRVTAFVRNVEKTQSMFEDLGDEIEYRQGSLDDLESMEAGLAGIDAVVHTAGFVSDWASYEDFRKVNVQGTKYLLVAAHAQGVKHFIHTSSLGVFGDTDQDQIDENNRYVLSSDAYSNSKIYAEIFVRRYCQENGIAFTIFRPGFIYGEGDNNFFPRLIENLEAGKAKYIGSTENIVNTVYVGNIEELVVTIVGNAAAVGETYNVSDPHSTTIRELYDTVCEGLDLPKPTAVIPKPVSLGAATVIETLAKALGVQDAPPLTRKKVTFVARSRSVNAKKAYSLIGREPFSFQQGIRRTLEHIRNATR